MITRITVIQNIRKGEVIDEMPGDVAIVHKLNILSEFAKWQVVKKKVIRIV